MRLKVKFRELGQSLKVKFGETYRISDGGFERGYAEGEKVGYSNGYAEGESKGIEQGYEQGYNDGNTMYYALSLNSAFGWRTFPENYNLVLKIQKLSSLNNAFRNTKNLKSVKIITDNKESALNISYMCGEASHIETVDLSECSRKISDIQYAFYNVSALKYIIGALDLSAITATTNYDFTCLGLREVEFVPNTIPKSIRFTSSALSVQSRNSIINGLADLTGQTSQKVQFSSSILASLTEEQIATILSKNWTT